jgi:acetyl-CoA synthetase
MMASDTTYPGLMADGSWVFPARLNMAAQALDHDEGQLALIDLTGPDRHDVSVGALHDHVDRIARHLLEKVKPGDRVGVLLSQSVGCAAAHLAIWKIGAISVPLFKLFQHDALASRINDAGLSYVVTDAAGETQLGALATPLRVEPLLIAGAEAASRLPFADTRRKPPLSLSIRPAPPAAQKGPFTGIGYCLAICRALRSAMTTLVNLGTACGHRRTGPGSGGCSTC